MGKMINVNGTEFLRIPIKTRILQSGDDFVEIIKTYASAELQPDDMIAISESPLAITQGRAINESDIKVGFLANILWRFVSKVPYGIGLRSPTSMQCAIDECGAGRILFAAIVGGFTRVVLRRKGDFYRIAGKQAALIDAAHTTTVNGFEAAVIKGPLHPELAAQNIADATGYEIAIMDINDIGGSWCIGHSKKIDSKLIELAMKDNPQGQGDELTPICIVRKIGI
jgi:hypothetical protein